MCLFIFSTCFGPLCTHHQEEQLHSCDIWYLLFCMDDCLVRSVEFHSHKYSCFSRWWVHSRPKHVEKRNKLPKKNCAPSWLYLQDYAGMHGQQNIILFITLYFMRVWRVTRNFFLQKFLVGERADQEMSPWTSLFSKKSLRWMCSGQPTSSPCLY